MQGHRLAALVTVVALFVSLPRSTLAGQNNATPCCSITGISSTGLVTASETATGRVFQFRVADMAVLASLHVGQQVWADFAKQAVALADGGTACCGIIGPIASGPVDGAVTAINTNGLVTATEVATARVFQFQVTDQAALHSMHVGQPVWADFAAKKVALGDGAAPCCKITGPVASGPVDGAHLPAVANAEPCCNVTVNPAMKGRLGRLLVVFPEGADASGTWVEAFKAGESQRIQGASGSQTWELLPGSYAVTVSGKRVEGVTVRAGSDTRVKVGMLRVSAGANTWVEVMDTDKKTRLHGSSGAATIGLPPGTFYVNIAGQLEAVTIREGKITDF